MTPCFKREKHTFGGSSWLNVVGGKKNTPLKCTWTTDVNVCLQQNNMDDIIGRHDKWIVVTTIVAPTNDIHIIMPGVIFLSIEDQQKMKYELIKYLPSNNYGRKMIGFLYAIEHGATVIHESDDDNTPYGQLKEFNLNKEFHALEVITSGAFNPFPHFGQPSVWPRGFPITKISKDLPRMYHTVRVRSPLIRQGSVSTDPDVDSIFRLTRKHTNDLNLTFDRTAPPVVVPKGAVTPFNTQTTTFLYDAFWLLFLPPGVHIRFIDIWRSYWAQPLLWLMNQKVVYMQVTADQCPHRTNLFSQMKAETLMHETSDMLTDYVSKWTCDHTDIIMCGVQLAEELVHLGFWRTGDDIVLKAWLRDLQKLCYVPPYLGKYTDDFTRINNVHEFYPIDQKTSMPYTPKTVRINQMKTIIKHIIIFCMTSDDTVTVKILSSLPQNLSRRFFQMPQEVTDTVISSATSATTSTPPADDFFDGQVRKVRAKNGIGFYDRPIHKLCLIAMRSELDRYDIDDQESPPKMCTGKKRRLSLLQHSSKLSKCGAALFCGFKNDRKPHWISKSGFMTSPSATSKDSQHIDECISPDSIWRALHYELCLKSFCDGLKKSEVTIMAAAEINPFEHINHPISHQHIKWAVCAVGRRITFILFINPFHYYSSSSSFTDADCSPKTIRRHPEELGFKNKKRLRVPRLLERHKSARLEFAREHEKITSKDGREKIVGEMTPPCLTPMLQSIRCEHSPFADINYLAGVKSMNTAVNLLSLTLSKRAFLILALTLFFLNDDGETWDSVGSGYMNNFSGLLLPRVGIIDESTIPENFEKRRHCKHSNLITIICFPNIDFIMNEIMLSHSYHGDQLDLPRQVCLVNLSQNSIVVKQRRRYCCQLEGKHLLQINFSVLGHCYQAPEQAHTHALTGCDSTNALFGVGKKTVFTTFQKQIDSEAVDGLADPGGPDWIAAVRKLVLGLHRNKGGKCATLNELRYTTLPLQLTSKQANCSQQMMRSSSIPSEFDTKR
ncbi:putative glycosyltransferase STELLO1 [Nymphon striatum]|nr:putative glycosyltransferase STELLO1 [Nymphon striatum]